MPTPVRYLLFQLPGWALAAVVAAALEGAGLVPPWAAVLMVVVWMTKDLVLYPLVRRAYEPAPTGAARLVGARAVAREPLDPTGYVEIEGQLWRAELAPHEAPVARGETVTVRGVDGLTLRVSSAG
jgi:membrane protein implicated in regulation of membrane protease activity